MSVLLSVFVVSASEAVVAYVAIADFTCGERINAESDAASELFHAEGAWLLLLSG